MLWGHSTPLWGCAGEAHMEMLALCGCAPSTSSAPLLGAVFVLLKQPSGLPSSWRLRELHPRA